MTEGLITSFLALLGGLVCGGFLSEAISLTTARLVGHGIITHQLSFSVSAAIFTSLGFLIIQFVALFVLCGKLFRKELHQLVYGEMAKKQRTGNPYVSFVSFAIGTVILLVAYWIVVEHFMAASGAMLLIAVLLGIIGTILFIRGLARILSIWAASIKHKATRGLYVFTLRQLHENVVNKYISISVASILMMLTIMLITDGSVRIMSYGSELTRGTSVYDFTVMGNDQIVEKYLSNEQIRPYVSNLNRMEIGNIKSTASDGISSPVDWSKFRKQIVQHLPQDVVDPATQEDGRIINVDHQLLRSAETGYYIETPKTKSGIRQIPMSEKVYEAFNRVLKRRRGAKAVTIDGYSNFLFLNRDGYPKTATNYDGMFRGLAKKYNKYHEEALPKVMTPHTLRHTFCTNMANAGMNPKALQYIMGHSNITMTLNYYAHATFDSAKAEMLRIAA